MKDCENAHDLPDHSVDMNLRSTSTLRTESVCLSLDSDTLEHRRACRRELPRHRCYDRDEGAIKADMLPSMNDGIDVFQVCRQSRKYPLVDAAAVERDPADLPVVYLEFDAMLQHDMTRTGDVAQLGGIAGGYRECGVEDAQSPNHPLRTASGRKFEWA